MSTLIETLVYAAALDVYRRMNRNEVSLTNKQAFAILFLADWNSRPAFFESDSEAL